MNISPRPFGRCGRELLGEVSDVALPGEREGRAGLVEAVGDGVCRPTAVKAVMVVVMVAVGSRE